jgi:hypothetical protein
MLTNAFDRITRTASRRDSMLALGGAGLAATLSGAFGATAKPKPGKLAKKKVKAKCKSQVGQCTLTLNLVCNAGNDPEVCKEAFLPCCDFLAACNAGEMLQCIFSFGVSQCATDPAARTNAGRDFGRVDAAS